MGKNGTSATIELPYPENDARTHWGECWMHRGHHNCAVARVRELEAERDRLREALKGLSKMYTTAWDRVDGALVMLPPSVPDFEEAHSKARVVLGCPLLGDLPGDDDELAALKG